MNPKPSLIFTTTILFFLCFPAFNHLQAQSALEFSDVINLRNTCASGAHVIDTVPAGKAWKIESIMTYDTYITLQVNPNQDIFITSSDFNYGSVPTGQAGNGIMVNPIWLKEGEILKASCLNGADYYFISILEFNITP